MELVKHLGCLLGDPVQVGKSRKGTFPDGRQLWCAKSDVLEGVGLPGMNGARTDQGKSNQSEEVRDIGNRE